MISAETIAAWREIERSHYRMSIMWAILVLFDAALAAWSYYVGDVIALAIDAALFGFAVGMILNNRAMRSSFEAHRRVVIAYEGALDIANEHIQMLSGQMRDDPPLAPDTPPTMWKGTKH